MERNVAAILRHLGEDPARQGLKATPRRVRESLEYLTSGYKGDLKAIVNGAIYDDPADEMIAVCGIEVYSLCEHHMLPFVGKAHVAYLPKGKIIGLSKIPRIVDMYARRLQVQERMTTQIAEAVMEVLKPRGCGVVIEADHFCMRMRGVEKQSSYAVTSCMLGRFRADARTRAEFLQLVHVNR
ncbi:MAG TPA: GTP cyclohydrolase I FolE [Planctomycetota bacterium]|nr:GTP cyclohydrolase I FolE [Planctomycetota bacterium]